MDASHHIFPPQLRAYHNLCHERNTWLRDKGSHQPDLDHLWTRCTPGRVDMSTNRAQPSKKDQEPGWRLEEELSAKPRPACLGTDSGSGLTTTRAEIGATNRAWPVCAKRQDWLVPQPVWPWRSQAGNVKCDAWAANLGQT
eukprot:357725-Chlamydomonas_euryale.AAC.2